MSTTRTTYKILSPSLLMILNNVYKRMLHSNIFATGPSKLGNVVCQMENQIKSRKNQGDNILQVCTRQKNRTPPETVWRDSKSISSSKIFRNHFRLPTQFQKHFEDILDRCNTRYHCLSKATSQQKMGT